MGQTTAVLPKFASIPLQSMYKINTNKTMVNSAARSDGRTPKLTERQVTKSGGKNHLVDCGSRNTALVSKDASISSRL